MTKLYMVFSGTTDHRDKLLAFLNDQVSGFTGLQSFSAWNGLKLGGDVLLFFNQEDAEKARTFLTTECHQQSAPVFVINGDLIDGLQPNTERLMRLTMIDLRDSIRRLLEAVDNEPFRLVRTSAELTAIRNARGALAAAERAWFSQ